MVHFIYLKQKKDECFHQTIKIYELSNENENMYKMKIYYN